MVHGPDFTVTPQYMQYCQQLNHFDINFITVVYFAVKYKRYNHQKITGTILYLHRVDLFAKVIVVHV